MVEHFSSHSGSLKHIAPVLVGDLTRLHTLAGEAKGEGTDREDGRKETVRKSTCNFLKVSFFI